VAAGEPLRGPQSGPRAPVEKPCTIPSRLAVRRRERAAKLIFIWAGLCSWSTRSLSETYFVARFEWVRTCPSESRSDILRNKRAKLFRRRRCHSRIWCSLTSFSLPGFRNCRRRRPSSAVQRRVVVSRAAFRDRSRNADHQRLSQ